MDVKEQVADLANRYRCTSDDPILGIYEAVTQLSQKLDQALSNHTREMNQALKDSQSPLIKAEESLTGLLTENQTLQACLNQYQEENRKVEQLTLYSAQNLSAAKKNRRSRKILVFSRGDDALCAVAHRRILLGSEPLFKGPAYPCKD